MKYKLNRDGEGITKIDDQGVITFIPDDMGNSDWQAYQAWLALGNTPLPADS